MRFDILTLFPEMFTPVTSSILGKACDKNLLDFNFVDIREYSLDKHKSADDYSFGGGPGLVMADARQKRHGEGSCDAFVAKFSPSGQLRYATYLGGNDWDNAYALAVDGSGNVWVAGNTGSKNFPVRVK